MYKANILEPSGRADETSFLHNLQALREAGLQVDFTTYDEGLGDRFSPQGINERSSKLFQALCSDCHYVIASRGGYGASDLLSTLDWDHLKLQNPKILLGFSDISAIQLALYTSLGWPALHGPMPGSPLWSDGPDIDLLLSMLQKGRPWHGELKLKSFSEVGPVRGTLLGGCLSVLTNLIGTPYIPKSLKGSILFFEDTNENAPRVLRFWNQWLASRMFDGVSAIILGRFHSMEGELDEKWLFQRLLERTQCPIFFSEDFGHDTPNYPIAIGTEAEIISNHLNDEEFRWMLVLRISK